MRLKVNLLLLACVPSLLLWLFLDVLLLSQIVRGITEASGVIIFIAGNWGWFTLIKACVTFNLEKEFGLLWIDYLGLLAGAVTVGYFVFETIILNAMNIVFLPPLVLAGLIYKVSRLEGE